MYDYKIFWNPGSSQLTAVVYRQSERPTQRVVNQMTGFYTEEGAVIWAEREIARQTERDDRFAADPITQQYGIAG